MAERKSESTNKTNGTANQKKRVAVIGSGACEHAICWKLRQSPQVGEIYAIPGNAGIRDDVSNIELILTDITNVKNLILRLTQKKIDLVIVVPTTAIQYGMCDKIRKAGFTCFGPDCNSAKIGYDKVWSKDYIDRLELPTAPWKRFTETGKAEKFIEKSELFKHPWVVKVYESGGVKKVTVGRNQKEALSGLCLPPTVISIRSPPAVCKYTCTPLESRSIYTQARSSGSRPSSTTGRSSLQNVQTPKSVITSFTSQPSGSSKAGELRYKVPPAISSVNKSKTSSTATSTTSSTHNVVKTKRPPRLEMLKESSTEKIIVVEELLKGEEVTVMVFTDSKNMKIMLPVQSYKRYLNHDRGKHTKGMGAFGPFYLSEEENNYIEDAFKAIITRLNKEGMPYKGIISAAFMITKDEPIKIIGFDCTFTDLETEVLLPLLKIDFYTLIDACCNGSLNECPNLEWDSEFYSAAVVLHAKPDCYGRITSTIRKLERNSYPDEKFEVFYENANVILGRREEIDIFKGPVLHAVGMDKSLFNAVTKVTNFMTTVDLGGLLKHYRTDIAQNRIIIKILEIPTKQFVPEGLDFSRATDIMQTLSTEIRSTYAENSIEPSTVSRGVVIEPNFEKYKELYKNPVFVTSSQGVGTKLKFAQQCNMHDMIGQDLVAMCANDILACGAKPLFFYHYCACGKLEPDTWQNLDSEELQMDPVHKRPQHAMITAVVKSVIEGCKEADCILVGREPTTMPGFYKPGQYDLSGYIVGVVEKELMLPKEIKEGDEVIYLPSNGLHSSGFHHIRSIMKHRCLRVASKPPFARNEKATFEEEFLKPTKMYTEKILPLVQQGSIKAFIQTADGGVIESISQILRSNLNLKVVLDAALWDILPEFGWIAATSGIDPSEMMSKFNCGIGAIVIVDPSQSEAVSMQLGSRVIGTVVTRNPERENQVTVANLKDKFRVQTIKFESPVIKDYKFSQYKRVAVLLSGTGYNLEALIEDTRKDISSPTQIVYVISNKPKAAGLEIAKNYGIPTCVIDDLSNGKPNESDITKEFNRLDIQIICVAGFSQPLSEKFVKEWNTYYRTCISIHPSLYPAFKNEIDSQSILKYTLKSSQKFSGCTIFYTQMGKKYPKIIEQAVVRVKLDDDEETLGERIKAKENKIYPRGLRLAASGAVLSESSKRLGQSHTSLNY